MKEKKCVGGYYRIRKAYRPDPVAEYEMLQKGYGTEHPEQIIGYAGLFFGRGDVFVSETVGEFMRDISAFRDFVFQSLKQFQKEDYGQISKDDEFNNAENRWLGSGDLVMGRYGYYREANQGKDRYDAVIRIRTWNGNTWITYDAEPDLFLLLKGNGVKTERNEEQIKQQEEFRKQIASRPAARPPVPRSPGSRLNKSVNLNPQYSAEEEAKLREFIRTAKTPFAREMAEDALLRMGCKP